MSGLECWLVTSYPTYNHYCVLLHYLSTIQKKLSHDFTDFILYIHHIRFYSASLFSKGGGLLTNECWENLQQIDPIIMRVPAYVQPYRKYC